MAEIWIFGLTILGPAFLRPLEQALYARRPARNSSLVHHSDRGSHVSIRYSKRLAEADVEPSVGSRGDSYDTQLKSHLNADLV